jgi:hypothetical protein
MSIEDRKIPPRPGSEANYARAYRLPGGAAMATTETYDWGWDDDPGDYENDGWGDDICIVPDEDMVADDDGEFNGLDTWEF